MRTYFIQILVLGILLSISKKNICQQTQQPKKLNYSIQAGWQSNTLYWSIAGNEAGTNPNILSELNWTKVVGFLLQIGIRGKLNNKYGWEICAGFGSTAKGLVTDNDYNGDNRTGNYYSETFNANNGGFGELKVEIYQTIPFSKSSICPKFGIGQVSKHFTLLPSKPEHTGLNSKYIANFWKAFTGLDYTLQLEKTSLELGVEPFAFYYAAKANWNLIPTFAHPISFRQKTFGLGIGWSAKIAQRISKSANLIVQFENTYSWGFSGKDRAYYRSGNEAATRLNQVENSDYKISLGVATELGNNRKN